MKAFLIFILLSLVALSISPVFIYLRRNWRRLIWENKGKVFRIRTDGVNILSEDKTWWVVES